MGGYSIIVDKGHKHMYYIDTYLLCAAECDCLLRFTIFIKFIFFLKFSFQPQIVLNLFLFSGDLSLAVLIEFVLLFKYLNEIIKIDQGRVQFLRMTIEI